MKSKSGTFLGLLDAPGVKQVEEHGTWDNRQSYFNLSDQLKR